MEKNDLNWWDAMFEEPAPPCEPISEPAESIEQEIPEPEVPKIPEPEVPAVTESEPPSKPKGSPYRKLLIGLTAALVLVSSLATWLLVDKLRKPTVDASTQALMELCKDGVTEWQSAEAYHLTQSLKRYGGYTTTSDGSETEYWRSGENFMSISYYSYSHGDNANGVAKVNGEFYAASSATNRNGESTLTQNWYRAEENMATDVALWPHWFCWEDNEYRLSYAAYSEESGGEIALLVIPQNTEGRIDSPYQVVFDIGLRRQLAGVTVIATDPELRGTSEVCVITYRMSTYQPVIVLDHILNLLQEPIPIYKYNDLWW